MLAISLVNNFIMKQCFPSGTITINSGYLFHLVLICMRQLKYGEKYDELTYDSEYLSFIDEY